MEISIYALVDPRDMQTYYVGQSGAVKARFLYHMAQTTQVGRTAWMRDLRSNGMRPVLEILEVTTEENADKREQSWIASRYEDGHPLLNRQCIPKHTSGTAGTLTDEDKALLRQLLNSGDPEVREMIVNSDFGRSLIATGVGGIRTVRKSAASKANGMKGGRPIKSLSDIPCCCGAEGLEHRSFCSKSKVIRYRRKHGLPLE